MAPVMPSPGAHARSFRLAVLLVLVAGVLVVGSPARACSCAPTDLERWLSEADGAFVGRWMDRGEIGDGLAAVTFEVERVVKGSFGPKAIVRTNAQGSACGLELLGAARTGLLLRKAADGVWESDLCSMVTPSELVAASGGHPPDPAIAPVSAGWEPVSIVWLVGAVIIAIAGLVWLTRRRARRTAA